MPPPMTEKEQLIPAPALLSSSRTHRRSSVVLCQATLCLALVCSGTRWMLNKSLWQPQSTDTLAWFSCPDVTETLCAYLSVPLDYSNPKPNDTVSLALRKYPATVPRSQRLGSLFINPGGPGGSGHQFVLRAGSSLSIIVEGRYDIISWDPRGVNLTSPSLGCFENSGDAARFVHDLEHIGLPYETRGVNGSAESERAWTYKLDAYLSSLDGACEEKGNKALLRSSSTAFVARDLKSILEAIGEKKLNYWGFRFLQVSSPCRFDKLLLELTWTLFSDGTILGATFSAMFPELVNRALLDGVSDSELYTNDMWGWGLSGMNDTMKTWRGFVDSCAESGIEGCALATVSATGDSIEKRITQLTEKLRTKPTAVSASKVGPGIVTSSDVHYAIFNALYSPKFWPEAARALAELEKGDGTCLFEQANRANDELSRIPSKNPFNRAMGSSVDTTAAIMCSDTHPIEDRSIEKLESYGRELGSVSITGEIWAIWVGTCSRWTHKAIETYRGPWNVAEGLRKTNFPILFFSQTGDPVTPLAAAEHMARSFGSDSASLLVQHGFGHCSLAHPSICTALAARKYFLEGIVPTYGTECHADPGFLFPHPNNLTSESVPLAEDPGTQKLRKALEHLAGELGHVTMKPASLRSF